MTPALILLSFAVLAATPARFAVEGDALRLETDRYELRLDSRTGALLSFADHAAGSTPVLRGGPDLWRIKRHKAPPLAASMAAGKKRMRVAHEWHPGDRALVLKYSATEADVAVSLHAGVTGVTWQSEIRMKQGTALTWECPTDLAFDGGHVNTLYLPDRLGIGFTREFFTGDIGASRSHHIGPEALSFVTGETCAMRPVQDQRVALQPGPDADAWLPEWYRNEMRSWRVMVNRSPQGGKHDACLVRSEHGPWLTGYRLDGKGWLFRFGGFLDEADFRPRLASVAATLARALPRAKSETGSRIGVLDFRLPATPGVQGHGGAAEWSRQLERLPPVRRLGLDVVALRTPGAILDALRDAQRFLAIINPGGESFPCTSADEWQDSLAAVKAYVRAGGVWWETGGGYPFHTALVPHRETTYTVRASRLFSDWVHLDSNRGRVSLYGAQAPGALFVCPELSLAARHGPGGGGRLSHRFLCHVIPEETWQTPALHLTAGVPFRESLRGYKEVNGVGRPLSEKLPRDKLGLLARTPLLKLQGMTFEEQIRIVRNLRSPMLVHAANYLHGGFDKQYPDHLPFPPSRAGSQPCDARAIHAGVLRGYPLPGPGRRARFPLRHEPRGARSGGLPRRPLRYRRA